MARWQGGMTKTRDPFSRGSNEGAAPAAFLLYQLSHAYTEFWAVQELAFTPATHLGPVIAGLDLIQARAWVQGKMLTST